jgi:hypothetical protein
MMVIVSASSVRVPEGTPPRKTLDGVAGTTVRRNGV